MLLRLFAKREILKLRISLRLPLSRASKIGGFAKLIVKNKLCWLKNYEIATTLLRGLKERHSLNRVIFNTHLHN